MKLLLEKEKNVKENKIYLKIYELFKSYLILLSDKKEMGIGNVTLASPSIIRDEKSNSSSYKLFGVGDDLLSTIIAERSSFILRKPVLLLNFVQNIDLTHKNFKILVNFLNNSLEMINKD